MTERLEALLARLLSEQTTVVHHETWASIVVSTAEERADLVTEKIWAQGERDAIRDRILAEFEKVRAERDEAREALGDVEWVPDDEEPGHLYCPWCLCYSDGADGGHSQDCRRQAALAKAEGEA